MEKKKADFKAGKSLVVSLAPTGVGGIGHKVFWMTVLCVS